MDEKSSKGKGVGAIFDRRADDKEQGKEEGKKVSEKKAPPVGVKTNPFEETLDILKRTRILINDAAKAGGNVKEAVAFYRLAEVPLKNKDFKKARKYAEKARELALIEKEKIFEIHAHDDTKDEGTAAGAGQEPSPESPGEEPEAPAEGPEPEVPEGEPEPEAPVEEPETPDDEQPSETPPEQPPDEPEAPGEENPSETPDDEQPSETPPEQTPNEPEAPGEEPAPEAPDDEQPSETPPEQPPEKPEAQEDVPGPAEPTEDIPEPPEPQEGEDTPPEEPPEPTPESPGDEPETQAEAPETPSEVEDDLKIALPDVKEGEDPEFDKALVFVQSARAAIELARGAGMDVTEAVAFYKLTEIPLKKRDYEKALKYAQKAKELAYEAQEASIAEDTVQAPETLQFVKKAEDAIQRTQDIITDLEGIGADTSHINILLQQAQEAFDNGDFEELEGIANEAEAYAQFVKKIEAERRD